MSTRSEDYDYHDDEKTEHGCDERKKKKRKHDHGRHKEKKKKSKKQRNKNEEQRETTTTTKRRINNSSDNSIVQYNSLKNDIISSSLSSSSLSTNTRRRINFNYKYIVAPMVGGSELAFRLLTRKYGAQLAYTPMMIASKFVTSEEYRRTEFQTSAVDRPLVCHLASNTANDFARAAVLAEPHCDAIDLNLGCPQRTAYVGHFGSYLLGGRRDGHDRRVVLQMIRSAVDAVSVPIFCKIRLLDTLEDTIDLCVQLKHAGVSLIAVHARYRASFDRRGPGSRDGPALLEQVLAIKEAIPDIPIIANGNVRTYDDVVQNLTYTTADGIMSAEGILDNPALFLPRFGTRQDDATKFITIPNHSSLLNHDDTTTTTASIAPDNNRNRDDKKERKLRKKLRAIQRIEKKIQTDGESSINDDQRQKLSQKSKVETQLVTLLKQETATTARSSDNLDRTITTTMNDDSNKSLTTISTTTTTTTTTTTLGELYETAHDKLMLAYEYLDLVRRYPTKLRTVVFHTRRMLKDMLNHYQLMEECISCQSVDDVRCILDRCRTYQNDPQSFVYDVQKAKQQKDALARKKYEEGKRKAFEARMIRKAKREGKTDLEHYLRIGAEIPTQTTIQRLKSLQRDEQLRLWKQHHSQHCLAYHLDPKGCTRDRACAFLHVEAKGDNTFVESDEVAG